VYTRRRKTNYVYRTWRLIQNNLEVWAHKTSLTPPCFIEVPVPEPSQQSERPCICVSGHRFCLFLPFFYKILELFRECGIFLFLFIYFVVFFLIIFSFLCIILYTIVCLIESDVQCCIWILQLCNADYNIIKTCIKL
jgi:cellulose synthase/poly-beta-1,6-N-acetylglucosamine synthase-like glycosyltransferase